MGNGGAVSPIIGTYMDKDNIEFNEMVKILLDNTVKSNTWGDIVDDAVGTLITRDDMDKAEEMDLTYRNITLADAYRKKIDAAELQYEQELKELRLARNRTIQAVLEENRKYHQRLATWSDIFEISESDPTIKDLVDKLFVTYELLKGRSVNKE